MSLRNIKNIKEVKNFPLTLLESDANEVKVFLCYSVLIMKTKDKKERENK